MPPGRKKKATKRPEPEPEPQPSPSPSAADNSLDDSNLGSQDDGPLPPPFFNATFVAHRLSPLHVGSQQQLDQSRLQVLNKRLRDTLIGDVVRGVQVGLLAGTPGDDGSLGRAGALEQVEWRWVAVEDLLGPEPDEDEAALREGSLELGTPDVRSKGGSGGAGRHGKKRALSLELNYENARYGAVLFPDIGGEENTDGVTTTTTTTASLPWTADGSQVNSKAFLHLPLLLLRVPVSLRTVIIDFLATTFDCRASPLRMGTRSLIRSWEDWLAQNGLLRHGGGNNRRVLNKDAMLTLGFHLEPPSPGNDTGEKNAAADSPEKPQKHQPAGLKALDIIIPAEHVGRFVRAGEKLPPITTPTTTTLSRQNNKNKNEKNKKRQQQQQQPSTETEEEEEESEETRRTLRRKLAGGPSQEEGWHWTPSSSSNNKNDIKLRETYAAHQNPFPFTHALASYLSAHLALDLYHPAVRIQRLACDGFLLSADGKLKIFGPLGNNGGASHSSEQTTAWRLVRDLVGRAKGPGWSEGALRLVGAAEAAASSS